MALKIKSSFRDLCPKLSEDELAQLEENILTDGMVINPIVVYDGFIVDGHNRYEIAQKHNIPYEVTRLTFDTDAEAMAWIYHHQKGRRNWTKKQAAYARGKIYAEEKQTHGGERKSGSSYQSDNLKSTTKTETTKTGTKTTSTAKSPSKTAERIAKEEGVGQATVLRNATFAEDVDKLAAPIKQSVLNESLKATNAEVKTLAQKPKTEQQKIVKAAKDSGKSIKEILGTPPLKQKTGREISPAKLADSIILKYYSPLAKGIGKLAEMNGGKGPAYKAARSAMNEVARQIKLMRSGNQ